MSNEKTKLGQEPAFPVPTNCSLRSENGNVINSPEDGISKRTYIATKILCSLISNADRHSQEGDCMSWNYHHLSEIAFTAADELLKQE